MILAVPAIGVLKILLAHSDHLKPFVILLEDKDRSDPEIPILKPSKKEEKPEAKMEEKIEQ